MGSSETSSRDEGKPSAASGELSEGYQYRQCTAGIFLRHIYLLECVVQLQNPIRVVVATTTRGHSFLRLMHWTPLKTVEVGGRPALYVNVQLQCQVFRTQSPLKPEGTTGSG